MPGLQLFTIHIKETRRFAVALQAVVVSPNETTLLLSSPTRDPEAAWQVGGGA
jgi:hypothetical protein